VFLRVGIWIWHDYSPCRQLSTKYLLRWPHCQLFMKSSLYGNRCYRTYDLKVLTVMIIDLYFLGWALCRALKVNKRFGGTYRLHLQGQKLNETRNKSQCKWQGKPTEEYLSEKSVGIQRTTQRHIPEDGTFHYCAFKSSLLPVFTSIEPMTSH
jgi:hypothetical protein